MARRGGCKLLDGLHTLNPISGASAVSISPRKKRISFGFREWSGAFGDIGTDLPLLAGMLMVSGMSPVRVLVIFGLLQVASGWIYGMPMPIQPLKVVAALVITQNISGDLIVGAGLAIALVMLLLTLSKSLETLARIIPSAVVRGIQFGLGLKLCLLAMNQYVGNQGVAGYVLALIAVVLMLCLSERTRVPVGAVLLLLGAGAALLDSATFSNKWIMPATPDTWHIPSLENIWMGFFLLALPQIPLSLGNSVLATQQLAGDWFPEHKVTVRKIGLTYSIFNIVAALFGGVPVCHGSGGIAGHYAFGGRTGGSVILYGAFYIVLGLAVAYGAYNVLMFFPLPILGIILVREGFVLMDRLREAEGGPVGWKIAVLVGILSAFVPNGFVIGMITGTILVAVSQRSSARYSISALISTAK